jgi:hypothetical protein
VLWRFAKSKGIFAEGKTKKVDELDGAELDYWVAKAEGLDKRTEQQEGNHLDLKIIGEYCYLPSGGAYRPS